jgi:hypothetical protein
MSEVTLSLTAAADIFGVAPHVITNWGDRGWLEAIADHGEVRYSLDSIESLRRRIEARQSLRSRYELATDEQQLQ